MGTLGGGNTLLTPDELAALFRVPKKTIYSEWRVWGLEAVRIGRHLRFRARAIEDFLTKCEIR